MTRITDFLETERSQEELRIALMVLREFKACESEQEWIGTPFFVWAKLEQFEEFLAHLVEGTPLREDTIRYREAHE